MYPVLSEPSVSAVATTALQTETSALEPAAIADALLRHGTTPLGVDVSQLRAGVQAIGNVSPSAADATRGALEARLSPVEAGALSQDDPALPFPFSILSLDFLRYVGAGLAHQEGASFAQSLFGIRSPADAPPSITFPEGVNKRFQEQWNNSLPGGYADEQGGTLTYDKAYGTLGLMNLDGAYDFGSLGSFSPDRYLPYPDAYGVLGAFHTHPYSEAEGGFTGVSFSGGDVATMLEQGDRIAVVQSGEQQFMLVRTDRTPTDINTDKVAERIDARSAELQRQGVDFATATDQAVKEAAERLGLAYYKGSNGTLDRVTG